MQLLYLKGLESNLEESGVDIGETQDLAEEKIIDDVPMKIPQMRLISEILKINENINLSISNEK